MCTYTSGKTELYLYRNVVQWNLVIKRSDITKPSNNKVILLVPALYISLLFYIYIFVILLYIFVILPDITR